MIMEFKFKTRSRPHQLEEFEKYKEAPARALLWQMRSGKSKAVIDIFAWQFCQQNITGVLIIAPNEVHYNWLREEIPRHCPVSYVGHTYRANKVKSQAHILRHKEICRAYEDRLSIFAINAESIRTDNAKRIIEQFLKAHKGKAFLIVDECHDFRTPSSKRTRRIMSIRKHCQFKRILTGTAMKNSPLAAYSQFEILSPQALGFRNYGQFKQEYAVYQNQRTRNGRMFPALVKFKNLDDLQDKVSKWASVVLKEDCGIEIAEPIIRKYQMVSEQKTLYNKLVKEYILEDAAYDGGARTGKLQQIARGWYYDECGEPVDIISNGQNPALQILKREIDTQNCKTLIWCQYRHEIESIVKMLREENYMVVKYHGGVNAMDREKAVRDFMDYRGSAIFVGQPKAGGTGINLSKADAVIWFSIPQQNLILYEQASERATEVHKAAVERVHIIAEGTVDEIQHEGLKRKQSLSDMLAENGLKDLLRMKELI